ncbi:MAG: SRPBCC domain-containing protein [Sporocytophaga sp.]|uniref:SRPBCC domain-containing protein n=1 Tax=Sporocytophaga sp. TaxID=2231183 RepID=UPI001B00F067|nr:SRPBCC domain-containing protein [Sporocytophaga sp.]MBO9699760.1 SRPBCC domain-containing protein [Sporocytophaga sp.]
MKTDLIAQASIEIKTDIRTVWDALVNPKIIKEYLFGTDTSSDWKVGSRISFKGVWEGKPYEDGGIITAIEPEETFKYTYWSSMSGTPDVEENYANISYDLEELESSVRLTISQDNIQSEEAREHSEKNWGMVLDSMKKLLENK